MAAATVKTLIAVGGVTFVGYVVMRTTTPDKEKMISMLPPEMVTKEKMKLIEEQNERVFASLKRTMNSNEPVWKLKEAEIMQNKDKIIHPVNGPIETKK